MWPRTFTLEVAVSTISIVGIDIIIVVIRITIFVVILSPL